MKIRPAIHRKGAFTILEVVISLVIMGIAASGLIACFTGSFFIMRMARENQRATQIMTERAEALRVFNFTQVTNGDIPTQFSAVYDPTVTNGNAGTTFNGTVSVSAVPFTTTYSDSMREITIGVTWTTKGIARSRTMKTFIAKDGIQNYVF